MIYYEKPMHQQRPIDTNPALDGGMAASEQLSRQAISLPMHPCPDQVTRDRVIEAVMRAVD